jgi:hypothetical protein
MMRKIFIKKKVVKVIITFGIIISISRFIQYFEGQVSFNFVFYFQVLCLTQAFKTLIVMDIT